jgi:hypothetical protein
MGVTESISAADVRTIRYLAGSIDDLREITETVRLIVMRSCNMGELESVLRSISISATPMPKSLSSFILGFDLPKRLLEKIPCRLFPPTPSEYVASDQDRMRSRILGIRKPEIFIEGTGCRFGFNISSLAELIEAINLTVWMLQSRSERFEYINLKRRIRLKVLPLDNGTKGFNLVLQVPVVLESV